MLVVLPSSRPDQASLSTLCHAARLLGHELWFIFLRAMSRIARWHAHTRERNALMVMDDRMLDDIGLSRGDLLHEAYKPFWRE